MSADAATIEQPSTAATEQAPALTPGQRFTAAQRANKEGGETSPTSEQNQTEPKLEQAKEPAAKEPAKEPKVPAKPKTALDALLSGNAAEPKAEPAPAAEDPLKDLKLDPKNPKDASMIKLRQAAEERLARVHELEKQIGTPDPKLTGELETLRKTLAEKEAALQEREAKLAEYKDTIVAVNIEMDPDHRREFIDGRKERVDFVGSKFKSYGGDDAALSEALSLPEGRRRDEAIEGLLEPLSETAKAKILRGVAEIEALDERRAAILSNPQTSFEELQRKHAAQAQAQAEQSEAVKKATFDKIARELATSVPTLGFADDSLEGGKDWNAARAASNAAALALLGNDTTPEQIVAASIKAGDYDRLAGLFMESRKLISEQAARLAEYESAHPNTTGRKTPAPTKEQELAKLTPGQRFVAMQASGKNEDF